MELHFITLLVLVVLTAFVSFWVATGIRESIDPWLFLPIILILLGLVWRNTRERKIRIAYRNPIISHEDHRHVGDKIGPCEQDTVIATAYVSTDGKSLKPRQVIKSFIDYMLLHYPSIVPIEDIRKFYSLNKHITLGVVDRLKHFEFTCYVCYLEMIRRQTKREKYDYSCQEILTMSGYGEDDTKRSYRLLKRNLRNPYFWIVTILFAATATIGFSGTYYALGPRYPVALHQEFVPGSIPLPASRDACRIRRGWRSKKPTYSVALTRRPPPIRNVQFDRNSPVNAQAAFRYRLSIQNPVPDYTAVRNLINEECDALASTFSYTNYSFLDPFDHDTLHAWIDSRPYPLNRKNQLHESVEKEFSTKTKQLSPFIKDESYPKPTKPRFIVARHDDYKVHFGPLFQPLNDWLFHMPFSVKHMPSKDRPRYIEEYLNGTHFFVTDHTSFECAAVREVQMAIEQRIYRRIIPPQYHFLLDVLLEDVHMVHQATHTAFDSDAIRWSGEMNTSLGNTLVNYISIRVAGRIMGFDARCVVEGDDSLVAVPPGTSAVEFHNIMSTMGFNIKIDEHDRAGDAGYCSMYWNSSYEIVYDVRNRIPDLFWASPDAVSSCGRLNLLNAKLASMSFECPSIPVLYKFFNKSPCRFKFNSYEVDQLPVPYHVNKNTVEFESFNGVEPTMEQRAGYEQILQLSIADQLLIESMNLSLEESCYLMYRCCMDPRFAREEYEKQVNN